MPIQYTFYAEADFFNLILKICALERDQGECNDYKVYNGYESPRKYLRGGTFSVRRIQYNHHKNWLVAMTSSKRLIDGYLSKHWSVGRVPHFKRLPKSLS